MTGERPGRWSTGWGWGVDAEPGPTVKAVGDKHGRRWVREPGQWCHVDDDDAHHHEDWPHLLVNYGPVTDASHQGPTTITLTMRPLAESARMLLDSISAGLLTPGAAVIALAQAVDDMSTALTEQEPRLMPAGGTPLVEYRVRWVDGHPLGAKPTSYPTHSRPAAERLMAREGGRVVLESRRTIAWPADGEPRAEWPRYVSPWTTVTE